MKCQWTISALKVSGFLKSCLTFKHSHLISPSKYHGQSDCDREANVYINALSLSHDKTVARRSYLYGLKRHSCSPLYV